MQYNSDSMAADFEYSFQYVFFHLGTVYLHHFR